MLVEIPVAYPFQQVSLQRYAIRNGKISSSRKVSALDDVSQLVSANQRLGAASLSTLEDGSVVSTCAHETDWGVIVVTLLKGDERVSTELDFRVEATARVRCFDNSANSFRFVRVDAKGNIVELVMDKNTLEPYECVKRWLPDLLGEIGVEYSGAEVLPTMADFVSPQTVVVALSPYLLSIDLERPAAFVWSESDVKARMTGGLKTMFSQASDIWLGRVDPSQVDMPAVASLCTAGDNFVFSMHSDGSLRQWRLDANHRPERVTTMTHEAPEPSLWTGYAATSVALCGHVVAGKNRVVVAIHIQTHDSCSLSIAHSALDGSWAASKALTVPNNANAVCTMSFSAPEKGCSLTAAFETKDQRYQIALYRQDASTLLATDPEVNSRDSMLDDVASNESHRMTFAELVEQDMDADAAIEEVDALYLKRLFRPIYPRGVATVAPPSRASIKRALKKQFPSFRADTSRSLAATIVRAVHEGRKGDETGAETSLAVVPQEGNSTSLYDSIAKTLRHQSSSDLGVVEEEMDELDANAGVVQHEQRWKRFLGSVLEEESSARCPLCIASPPNGETMVVRAELISVLTESHDLPSGQNKHLQLLNECTNSILAKLESSSTQTEIQANENQVVAMMTDLSVLFEQSHIAHRMRDLGSSFIHPKQKVALRKALQALTEEEVCHWIHSISPVPLLTLLGAQDAETPDDQSVHNHIAGIQMRQAACGVIIRGIDSMRRLYLARCLLLRGIGSPVADEALRSYLHSVAVLWTCGQNVDLPTLPTRVSFPAGEPLGSKRLSFGLETHGILPDASKTSALDAHVIQASYSVPRDSTKQHDHILALSRALFRSIFHKGGDNNNTADSPYHLLTELGVLPPPTKGRVATDYPRLALRLMASRMCVPADNESHNVVIARKEAIAECSLIEANENPEKAQELWTMACDNLSVSSSTSPYDLPTIEHVYKSLLSAAGKLQSSVPEADAEMTMVAELHRLIYGGTVSVLGEDVKRLSHKPSTRSLFLPFFLAGQERFFRELNETEKESVEMLARTLLEVSNILSRLSILERHAIRLGRDSSNEISAGILVAIQDGIKTVKELLPPSVYNSMPEYISMWSLLFRIAEVTRNWDVALDACTFNPLVDRRVSCFRRLVISMVDAGALGELIDMRVGLVPGDSGTLDLHEIVSETLSSETLASQHSSESSFDALGCLFSAQAAKGNWKAAAQALDLRCLDAANILDNVGSSSMPAASDDLVTSAIGCSTAICLVADPADRFIVSGEFGSLPHLPSVDEVDPAPKSILKRSRDNDQPSRDDDRATSREDRLTRFMQATDLETRAFQSMFYRILSLDRDATPPAAASLVAKPSLATGRNLITELASFGYFDLAFLMGKAMGLCQAASSGGTLVSGRDIVHDCLSYILCKFAVPLALKPYLRADSGDVAVDGVKRYSLVQFLRCIDEIAGNAQSATLTTTGSKIWKSELLHDSAVGAAASELLRRCCERYSTAANPLAVEVAVSFLDCYPGTQLPRWLETQLVGRCSGLFAQSRAGGATFLGNPSVLIDLYMKKGMYAEGCDVVSAVLKGNEADRRARAAGRVVQRGDVDFVPYAKIDKLWNAVEYVVSHPGVGEDARDRLLRARATMEQAIEFHMSLLQISEAGQASAKR